MYLLAVILSSFLSFADLSLDVAHCQGFRSGYCVHPDTYESYDESARASLAYKKAVEDYEACLFDLSNYYESCRNEVERLKSRFLDNKLNNPAKSVQ